MATANGQFRLMVVHSFVLVFLASHVAGSPAAAAGANLRASAHGSIFCDICNDGSYDAGTDRPIARAKVTISCSAITEGSSDIVSWQHVAVSNSRGEYSFNKLETLEYTQSQNETFLGCDVSFSLPSSTTCTAASLVTTTDSCGNLPFLPNPLHAGDSVSLPTFCRTPTHTRTSCAHDNGKECAEGYVYYAYNNQSLGSVREFLTRKVEEKRGKIVYNGTKAGATQIVQPRVIGDKLFWLQQDETPLQYKVLSSHLNSKPKTKADKRVTVLARFRAQEVVTTDQGGFVVDTSGPALQFFYSTVSNYPISSRIYGVAQAPAPPVPQSPPFLAYEGGEFSGDITALELDTTVSPKTMYWIAGTLSIRSGQVSVVDGATTITDVQTLIQDTSALGLRAWQLTLDPVRKRLYALLDGPFPYGGSPNLGAFDISVNPPTRLFIRPIGMPISAFRDIPRGKFAIDVYASPPVLYGVVSPPFSFGPPPSGQTWSLYKTLANLDATDDVTPIAYGPRIRVGTESTAILGGDLLYGKHCS
eukprot:jgi/Chlat1/2554/Chrsp175S02397